MRHPTILWRGDQSGHCELIDQTLLPGELRYLELHDQEAMWDAIKRLAVRGAPAIGVAAAFGVLLGMKGQAEVDGPGFGARLEQVCAYLASSRPTAVNLFWALERMKARDRREADRPVAERHRALFDEAQAILREDKETCDQLGRHGAELVRDGDVLLTHCNAGALATAGSGTALSVMFAAKERGLRFEVFVDETRPLLQGARLTAWELMQAEIPATLICDNMAPWAMKQRGISRIFVGADRIAANGDAANKIGTYGVAVAAKAHDVPFYVVAPSSTFDLSLATGAEIPIEEREPEEVTEGFGRRTAPAGCAVWSPAFDVTPAELITGIVTEKGLIQPVGQAQVARILGS
ncbi:MAG: S-methyl-5-thioribose-1-phosphate isomerase [Planctomycetes bacterium]|nr:S-methyl-5-thioribose-1-phosphate isomerase [Planctomycetota bacterium]